jgi:hypothetical protein
MSNGNEEKLLEEIVFRQEVQPQSGGKGLGRDA